MAGNENRVLTKNSGVSIGLAVVSLVAAIGGVSAWYDIINRLDALKRGQRDTWTRTDDRLHMEDFARMNDLKKAPHQSVLPDEG